MTALPPRPCARCRQRPRNEYGTYCEACDDLLSTLREVNRGVTERDEYGTGED